MIRLIAVLLLLGPVSALAHSGFEGRWKVVGVEIHDKDSEWVKPEKLPAFVEVRKEKDRLLALYTDQRGVTIHCMTFREIIEGHEAILFGCPAPYKSSEVLSPLHRVKLQNGVLRSFTVTDKLIYSWSAEREKK